MLDKITTFFKEVQLEMKKVNWPTREQTIRYTLMVIGVAVAVAIFLGGFDLIFTEVRNCVLLKAGPCYTGELLGF